MIGQTAVCRSGHRVFVDTGRRCKKTRHEIEAGFRCLVSRDDDAPRINLFQFRKIRLQLPDMLRVRKFDQVIELTPANISWRNGLAVDMQTLQQSVGSSTFVSRRDREIEFNRRAQRFHIQRATAGLKTNVRPISYAVRFPQRVCRGQCGMTAEVNLRQRSKPAQFESV